MPTRYLGLLARATGLDLSIADLPLLQEYVEEGPGSPVCVLGYAFYAADPAAALRIGEWHLLGRTTPGSAAAAGDIWDERVRPRQHHAPRSKAKAISSKFNKLTATMRETLASFYRRHGSMQLLESLARAGGHINCTSP